MICLWLSAFIFLSNATAKSVHTKSYTNEIKEVNASELAFIRLVTMNKIEEVKNLLKQGISANTFTPDKNRRSALILATAGGHVDLAKELINYGADIDYQDSAGLTALSWSVMRKKNKLTEYLLSVNANANTLDNRSISPLMYAVGMGNIKIVEMLVNNHAQLNTRSPHSRMTPLLIAVENNDTDITLKLLELNADVNGANDYGYTPLMAAAEAGHIEILHILISNGAKIKAQNSKGMTALNFATEKGHWQIVDILKNQ